MPDPLVSVVIPSYNYGRFVTEAVDSVLAQTYPAVEVIVVDDGSTDDTRERLRPYQGRIRYLFQENAGLSAARNTGIRAASGPVVGLLDADDVWHPRKLEVQMRYLASHPDVGLLASAHITGPLAWDGAIDLDQEPKVERIRLEDLVVRTSFSPSSVLLRQECLQSVGLFDTALRSVEDRDMWLRVAARFAVVKLLVPLCWYRLHGGNMSSAAARMEENELRVLHKAFTQIEALRRCFLLRWKAYSYALCCSAYVHRAAGMHGKALDRLLRSLLTWPLPYRAEEVSTRFPRAKALVKIMSALVRAG